MPREVMGMSRGVATTDSRRSSLRRLAVARADGGGANLPAVFVESLAAMSATKLPGPEGHQKLGPLAARPPALRAEPATAVAVQEKVLAEIAHELGNFFHKLYYWSDYLKEKPARKSADSTAVQMLERTIKNLEDFLRLARLLPSHTALLHPYGGERGARGAAFPGARAAQRHADHAVRRQRVAEGGRRAADRSGAPLARLRGGGATSDEARGARVERHRRHQAQRAPRPCRAGTRLPAPPAERGLAALPHGGGRDRVGGGAEGRGAARRRAP